MDISPAQLRLLKRIGKKPIVRTDKHGIEDIEYLRDNGLVTVTQCDKPGDFFCQPRITEKGKAFLYQTCHSNRRANIALFLSIVAILLSLLTAFTPFPDWSKECISSLLQGISG